MDELRFDAWTRRRFGMAAGGSIATLFTPAATKDAVATKNRKKRRKRCRKLGRACQPGGKRTCCGKLKCDRISFEPSPQTRCCRKEGQPCGDDLERTGGVRLARGEPLINLVRAPIGAAATA